VKQAPDDSCLVDDIGHAGGAQAKAPPDVVEFGNTLVRVGYQREGEAVALAELLVALHGVSADANDDGIEGAYSFIMFTEAAGFERSAPGEITHIEVEHNMLAALPVCQTEVVTGVGDSGEIGRVGPFTQHTSMIRDLRRQDRPHH